ncbi:MAG: DUF2490 domain-containing protein [Methylococcales bacterium]|nr:DUF2490 domain-containing protein [Methylococcales bacterium]
MKNKMKLSMLFAGLVAGYPVFSSAAQTNDMFGVWGSVTLQGDLKFISPTLDKVKWSVMNQTRTRDDSPKGSRFTENLLFGQMGYQVTENASFWLGYVHDWIEPLNKMGYQESRPYQDFVWSQKFFSEHTLMLRTRMEERINETTGDVGYRARQLVQVNHPLPFVKDLSMYVGDEVLFYVNQNKFGKQGFSENRILSGLSYQLTPQIGADLGYLGQYVDSASGNNLFTHNLQANLRYKF